MENTAITQLIRAKQIHAPYYSITSSTMNPLSELIQEYTHKYPDRKIQVDEPLVLEYGLRCGVMFGTDKSHGIKMSFRHLPEPVVNKLIADNTVKISFTDGTGGRYDGERNEIECAGTLALYHEIGHYLFNNLSENEEQNQAVRNSILLNKNERIIIEDRLIPSRHKKYARLVGAYSGQYLIPRHMLYGTIDNRMNDLDEHFARNFDFLVRGKPLEVLENSKASLVDLLDFYQETRLIDTQFRFFYEMSLLFNHSLREPRYVPFECLTISRERRNSINLQEIADLIVFKKRLNQLYFKTVNGEPCCVLPYLPVTQEIAMRLDMNQEFADFCIAKNKDAVLSALTVMNVAYLERIKSLDRKIIPLLSDK